MFIVHAGNRIDAPNRAKPRFPASEEPRVARRIGAALDVLRPQGVVTAAAAGADLLLVEAAQRRGIPVHLVLPFSADRFREASVADLGERWARAYDEAVSVVIADDASTLEEHDLTPDDAGYRAANAAILDRAALLAGDDGVLVLAVRPRGGEGGTSVTDDLVHRGEERGWFLLEIDPRPVA